MSNCPIRQNDLPTFSKVSYMDDIIILLNFMFTRLHGYQITPGLTLSGPGGAQRPGWPNSQLPIRNLLSNDAQTWWLLVFILETPFGHILAKLVNQGGCCCSFLIETSQKFWKWKIFPMLENCWNWHGGQFWVEKNDSGHKNSFF